MERISNSSKRSYVKRTKEDEGAGEASLASGEPELDRIVHSSSYHASSNLRKTPILLVSLQAQITSMSLSLRFVQPYQLFFWRTASSAGNLNSDRPLFSAGEN